MGNEGIYNVGKDLVKENITFCQIECFATTSRVGLTHEILAKTSRLAWLFIFQSYALHIALSRVSFLWDTREIYLFILWNLSLHTLSHSSLTIRNPINIGKYDWRNLQSNLARNSSQYKIVVNYNFTTLILYTGQVRVWLLCIYQRRACIYFVVSLYVLEAHIYIL